MNTGVHGSFSVMAFSGYMLSDGIAVSCGSFIPSFFFFLMRVIIFELLLPTGTDLVISVCYYKIP